MRLIYSFLWWLALPIVRLRLWWRTDKEPGYALHVGERFARDLPQLTGKVIWVHAVSVGETRAAAPIIKGLLKQFRDHRILLTHMTPTGRAAAEIVYAPFGERVQSHYLPYDLMTYASRFFEACKPSFGVIMETEIWPNVLRAAKQKNIPVFLANARLSVRSAKGYARMGSLTREALADFKGIAAQSHEHAVRFRALGAKDVQVFGNMKFDVNEPAEAAQKADLLRSRISTRLAEPRLILCCASTREGEETLILRALVQRIKNNQWSDRLLLLIVPRHPTRFDEVAQLSCNYKLVTARRTDEAPISSNVQVLIGDSMGEMAAYYRVSQLAFVGGSLLPFGSQNFIEACAAGCPVLLGQHTYNFAEAAQLALKANAALTIKDADEMLLRAYQLLIGEKRAPGERSDNPTPKTREAMTAAGLEFAAEHRGASSSTIAWLVAHLADHVTPNSGNPQSELPTAVLNSEFER
jgi:3-deoxy-D-manno-octulosonic-acid transferase